ncbi:MAG: Threonine--tRNA ligase [Parcubacteria group bacterium ADurb.Bin316]|nr:MAG: Threonine--tRNA ligase [Parcubacteria group bacterium ADurb.Bin316]HOZ55861.1 threonine--tRNA ligase [bacterium]
MTKKNTIDLEMMRHSFSHVMAAAVLKLWPDVKFAIGPAIDNGFYYDFDFGDKKIGEDDLVKIEKEMEKIIKADLKFERSEIKIDEALAKEKKSGQVYKEELILDLVKEGEKNVSYYKLGDFEDLCRGPHVALSGELPVGSFKLTKIAGAYWRGDEKNKMLTRIYGVAFATKKELEDYLQMLEEAEKRDHRKLGKELDLFCFSELVGPGLPLYTPKGMAIIDELKKHIEQVCRNYGFEKVMTPHFAKIDLYETSGHAKKFGDELFHVYSDKGHKFVMKPVQCPHQTQIYASKIRSYRDLPIRYMESERQYRAEKSGEVGGLSRVYAITVEDGHTFCRPDQVKDEIIGMVNIIKDFYSALGLWGNHWVSLSVRDYDHPEKYIGESADWDLCEKMLQEVSDEMGLKAKRCEGEAALYGPKLDFMFRDAIGKEIQIPTVQVDFATPKKFNLHYTDKDGVEKSPVMVHRAILGSYERFLALLIEHFAGAFPVWLSPVQVKLIAVSEKHNDFVQKLADEFKKENIRVELDISDETVGNKIRKAVAEKVPYMLVIGDKEASSDKLVVRDRGSKDTREINKEEFFIEIKDKIVKKE